MRLRGGPERIGSLLDEAAARIEELEAALKPFAEAADSLDVVADEAAVIWGSDPMIQVRHFRRARAAFTPESSQ